MHDFVFPLLVLKFCAFTLVFAQSTATYNISNLPTTSEDGQTGTNHCPGFATDQCGRCQTLRINSLQDLCIWAPSEPNSSLNDTGNDLVAWCSYSIGSTRQLPVDYIGGPEFLQTPDYVQVRGSGNLSVLNIDIEAGGFAYSYSRNATHPGLPRGGLVVSNAWGESEIITEWMSYIYPDRFCFRACKPGPNATLYCNHLYDDKGCDWKMPSLTEPALASCQGDSGPPLDQYSLNTTAVELNLPPIPGSSTCYYTHGGEDGPVPTPIYCSASSASLATAAVITGQPASSISTASPANTNLAANAVVTGSNTSSSGALRMWAVPPSVCAYALAINIVAYF